MSLLAIKKTLRLLLAGFLSASVGFAFADERELEEIIVTGTKRAASQQDTPIAISTLTADAIAKTHGNDIRAIGDLSPNVNLTLQTGFNAVAGGIRGTGTISILTTQDPSVGILVDEFALNHVQTQFVELFDLEQVEVYRGPQGTLFGKNSTGGVIAITSKRPDMEEFGGSVQVGTSSYGSNSDGDKLQVAVDVPLIPGELAFRFAGSQTTEDGYYFNSKDTAIFPNSPLNQAFGVVDNLPPEMYTPTTGAGENLGGKDVFASKAKLLWQPDENFEAYFIYETVRDRSDSPPGVNETPEGEGFLWELFGFPGIQQAGHTDVFSTGMTQQGNGINIRDGHRVDVDGYYLTMTYSMENFSIKSITGYREQEETLPSTYTGEAFLSTFDATRNLEREQFQQELRLISEFDGPINFVAGAIFITDDLDFRAYTSQGWVDMLAPGPNMDLRNIQGDHGHGQVQQERDSLAFYADGSYQINDQWGITVGMRHTRDEKSFYKPTGAGAPCNEFTLAIDSIFDEAGNCTDVRSGSISRAGLTGPEINQREAVLGPEQYRFIADSTEEWTETTWRVVVDYKDSNDNLWYGSVATGFLAGGYSETCSAEQTCISYDPETNISYEVGFKGDLLDGMLRFNVSAFITDYEDLQRNQVFRFCDPISDVCGQETITLNAGESSVNGLEIETTWLATDNFTIQASLGYLDASYDEFDFDGVDLTSLDIPFASEYQVGLQATYTQALPSGATLTYYLSGHYQDEAEMSPFDPNQVAVGVARHPTFTQMESRTLVDASVTYTSSDEKYYATLFGKNLLDETYRVSANSVAFLWNFTQYGPPSQWGLEFGMRIE